MKSTIVLGALAAAMLLGLSSCYVPPPYDYPPPAAMPYGPPPPPAVMPYGPPPPPPPIAYRGCGPGWHWVRAHRNRWGRWVRGHCAHNW
jgi:hypothetical protein